MGRIKSRILVAMYFLIGLAILCLNKVRYSRQYRNPRGFKESEIERSIQHDVKGVIDIEQDLSQYLHTGHPFKDKTVLELGPGPDIGVGALLLDKGAAGYCGFDKNNLMATMSDDFFVMLDKKLASEGARQQLNLFKSGRSTRLKYVADPDFCLTNTPDDQYNLVVSRSAFEHFDNIEKTLKELSNTVRPGTVLYIQLDLMTHSRWIRQRDPNNIYRFPKWLYKPLYFPGIPNRVRPECYEESLRRNQWTNIILKWENADTLLNNREYTLDGLSREFDSYNMRILTCVIMATKQ